jgi:uncharacterized membrane protein
MEDYIIEAAYYVALLAEAVAIVIILLGIIKSIIYYMTSPLPFNFVPERFLVLRMQLGGALSLSLEFLIGADILKTAVSPSWTEIGMLGAIVVIRTVINYFLTEELRPEFEKVQSK